jgi:hypothetical protein
MQSAVLFAEMPGPDRKVGVSLIRQAGFRLNQKWRIISALRLLRFSPLATDAWGEAGPYAADGIANVRRAKIKKRAAIVKTIEAMNERDAQKLAKRRSETSPGRTPSN